MLVPLISRMHCASRPNLLASDCWPATAFMFAAALGSLSSLYILLSSLPVVGHTIAPAKLLASAQSLLAPYPHYLSCSSKFAALYPLFIFCCCMTRRGTSTVSAATSATILCGTLPLLSGRSSSNTSFRLGLCLRRAGRSSPLSSDT